MPLKDAPTKLQPYLFHGVELDYRGGEPVGDCPFCSAEGKFYVSSSTGLYQCKRASCDASGNIYQFIRSLHEISTENCPKGWYEELSEERGICPEFLSAWGIVPSYLTGEVLVPAYNIRGKMTNLSQWLANKNTGKRTLYSTPSLRVGLFGVSTWDSTKHGVFIVEGPWTGAALQQILSGISVKGDICKGGRVVAMFKRDNALASDYNVVGIPGCNTFRDVWTELFSDKDVVISMDNDKPRNDGSLGEGWAGTIRTARLLLRSDNPPKSLHGVKWGDKGYSSDYPKGFDLRDALLRVSKNGDGRNVKPPKAAAEAIKSVLGRIQPLNELVAREERKTELSNKTNKALHEPVPEHCESYSEVRAAWRKAFRWSDDLDTTLIAMLATCASTTLPGTAQLWLRVLGPPGSGKSTLCEALSVSKKYMFPLSVQKGFHSGSKTAEGDTCSLVPDMDNKTVIIKDGDTLMSAPNVNQSLSELRDIYDGVSRARYRNSKEAQNYTGLRTTFIVGGTSSLRRLNKSYLGDRFIDCIIYERGDDPDREASILQRAASNAFQSMKIDEEYSDAINDHNMLKAMELTAGYLHYLRENSDVLANEVTMSQKRLEECIAIGELVAYMRARPDKELADEDVEEVELPTRLTQQFVRLATNMAVVMNRQEIDDEVMSRAKKLARDTCKGITFRICRTLAKYPRGLQARAIGALTHKPTQVINASCRFLNAIGVVSRADEKKRNNHWVLDEYLQDLMKVVLDEE